MTTTQIIFDPKHQSTFDSAGLSRVEDFLLCPMQRVLSRTIEETSGELTPAGSQETFILTTLFPCRPRRLARDERSPGLADYHNLLLLRKAGVSAVEPVVAGEEISDDRLVGAFVVAASVPNAAPWKNILGTGQPEDIAHSLQSPVGRLDAIRALSTLFLRLHAAGLFGGDLFFRNILWRLLDGKPDPVVATFSSGRASPGTTPPSRRAEDLGTLLVDGAEILSSAECARLLLLYCRTDRIDRHFMQQVISARRRRIMQEASVFGGAEDFPGMPMSFHAPPGTSVSFDDTLLYELNLCKLADFATLLHHSPTASASRARRVYRLPGREGKANVHVKVDLANPLRNNVLAILGLRGGRSRSAHEWFALHRARSLGIAVPRPLGIAQRQSGRIIRESILIIEDLPEDTRRLDLLVDRPSATAPKEIRSLWQCIAFAIARMHARGVVHNGLYAQHIFVGVRDDLPSPFKWKVHFLDLEGSEFPPRVTLQHRARELATLRATIPPDVLCHSDWNAFLHDYVAASPASVSFGPLHEATVRQQRSLRHHWRVMESLYAWADRNPPLPPVPLEETSLVVPGHGGERHLIHADYRRGLAEAGMTSVLDFLYYGDVAVHIKKRRSIAKLQLNIAGERQTFFMKRHAPKTFREMIVELLRTGRTASPGLHECLNVNLLRANRIRTIPVVAAGEEVGTFRPLRSYLLTRQIEDAQPLDAFLRATPAPDRRLVREIIGLLALIARRFHATGFHHQDFYLNHVFIHMDEDGRPELILLDLQRVYRPWILRRRWIIKDLGQLNFSGERVGLSRTDRLRFIMTYLNVSTLAVSDKALIRRIVAKGRHVLRHVTRQLARNAPGYENETRSSSPFC